MTMPYKLAPGTKPSVLYLGALFYLCSVIKTTSHVGKKVFNMRYQAQKVFHGIFVVIPQHQKGCFFHVPNKQKIVSLYDIAFDEIVSSHVAYTSQPPSKVMAMLLSVSYIPYATPSKQQTGNIITSVQFEVVNLLSEYRNITEISDKSGDYSTLPPLISESKMGEIS